MMKTIIIDRAKWGGNADYLRKNDSKLLNVVTGKMCCMGIALNQLGVPKIRLAGVGQPSDVGTDNIPKLKRACGRFQELEVDLADLNDSFSLPQKEKESSIKGMFKKLGLKVTFKGRFTP